MATPYTMADYINLMTGMKNAGQNEQAFKLFNGLSSGAGGGAVDSALRQAWGEDAAKQWINQSDTQWGSQKFDPRTGYLTADGSQTLQGWDASRYDPNAANQWMKDWYNAGGGDAANTAASDAWVQNWAKGVGGTGYSPTASLAAANANPNVGVGVDAYGKPLGAARTPVTKGAAAPATGVLAAGVPATGTPPSGAPTAGYSPTARPADTTTPWNFFNDEGYQFRLKEGQDAIQNTAAAGGGLLSGKTLKDLTSYGQGLAADEYGQAYDRYNQNRNFAEGQFQTDRNFGRGVYQDDRDYGRGVYTDDRNFAEGNRRYDQGFGEDQRRYNQGFDYSAHLNDRNFNEDQRRYDQGFNYTAASGDRDSTLNTLRFLAGLGANTTNNATSLDTWLANLYGQNTMTGAGAGAGSTTANASNVNNFITQLLQAIMGNQMINRVTP